LKGVSTARPDDLQQILKAHAVGQRDPAGNTFEHARVHLETKNLVDVIDDSRSLWAEHGQFHWILAEAELWPTPIPCRGQLGFFHPPQLGRLR
jgi:hypothetical protein